MSGLTETRISFERFLADPSIPEQAEWVDGIVEPMHAVDDRHDALTRWLGELLGAYIRRGELGRLLGEPFLMKLPDEPAARSPDLFFVRQSRLGLVQSKYLDGAADIAIEVVSPESRSRDEVHKRTEYERGGVGEYWLLDPSKEEAIFHRLDSRGRFQEAERGSDLIYTTALLPEMRLETGWFWQRPLPDTIEILRAWGVA
jgi:Uma2 family endonuclease